MVAPDEARLSSARTRRRQGGAEMPARWARVTLVMRPFVLQIAQDLEVDLVQLDAAHGEPPGGYCDVPTAALGNDITQPPRRRQAYAGRRRMRRCRSPGDVCAIDLAQSA